MLRDVESADLSVLLVRASRFSPRSVYGRMHLTIYRVISLVFETVLFALTIAKFLCAVREGWGMGPIMQQFVADGTWAYALIFLVMLVNMMLYKFVHSSLTGICYTCVLLSFTRCLISHRRIGGCLWSCPLQCVLPALAHYIPELML